MMKFRKEIEKLIEFRDRIPEEFWTLTMSGGHRVIWFMNRQKPSIEANYSFDEERFGVTKEGKVIWGFDSGCSCPTPWEEVTYNVKDWKEFIVAPEEAFDKDWQDECYDNMKDYLLLIADEVTGSQVLGTKNAEVRRYLMKRIGYENIKKQVKAEVVHQEGTSELLKMKDGDMYVKVKDSSTEREYLLYVPEFIKSCRQGIAWTFGLSEKDYKPLIET